jgi:hypothetical protein
MTLAIWQRDAKKEADASVAVASENVSSIVAADILAGKDGVQGLALALFSNVALDFCAGALLQMSGARRSC